MKLKPCTTPTEHPLFAKVTKWLQSLGQTSEQKLALKHKNICLLKLWGGGRLGYLQLLSGQKGATMNYRVLIVTVNAPTNSFQESASVSLHISLN